MIWFFVLACGITWLCGAPTVLAYLQHRPPSSGALALAGLSAFGPTLAALLVARGVRGSIVWRWQTHFRWLAIGIAMPIVVHQLANVLAVAVGSPPERWLYLPERPEDFAALVVFPIGEELGWRGYAQPRLTDRYGMVRGSLVVGAVWTVWHVAMMVRPDGSYAWLDLATLAVQLPLHSVLIGWLYERSGRSLAVPLAIHAAAHVDNAMRIPAHAWTLRVLHVAVLLVLVLLVAVRRPARLPACGPT